MGKISLKKAAERLLEKNDILILCHRYPDGDTVGSAFALCTALRSLGKRANVMCGDIIPQKFSYIYNKIEPLKFKEKFIVAVDVASAPQLGVLEKVYSEKVDLCIDHHGSHRSFEKELLLDADASAAGEIIFSLLGAMGVKLDKDMADALYTAVSTDTGCFRFTNTNAKSHRVAASLIEAGTDMEQINRIMFETKSRAKIELEHRLYNTIRFMENDKIALMRLSLKDIAETGVTEGDIDGISGLTRQIEGVEIGILMREVEGGFKLSVRSVPPYDASVICSKFGGGGHSCAAGCTIRSEIEDEVRDLICDAALEELNKNI